MSPFSQVPAGVSLPFCYKTWDLVPYGYGILYFYACVSEIFKQFELTKVPNAPYSEANSELDHADFF